MTHEISSCYSVSHQDNGIFSWHHWVTANITHSLEVKKQTSSGKGSTKDHAASNIGHGIRASYIIWGTQWKIKMQDPLFKTPEKEYFLCSTVCLSSCHGAFYFTVLLALIWGKWWDQWNRSFKVLGVPPTLQLWMGVCGFTLHCPQRMAVVGRGQARQRCGVGWEAGMCELRLFVTCAYMLHCCIQFHLQNANSKIKLLRISRQLLQSINSQVWGLLLSRGPSVKATFSWRWFHPGCWPRSFSSRTLYFSLHQLPFKVEVYL